MAHLLKGKPKLRDQPAPSPSASHASLLSPTSGPRPGNQPGSSKSPFTSPSLTASTTANNPPNTSTTTGGGLNITLPNPLQLPVPSLRSRESTRTTDRTDALWAEMQATLEAVELSAANATGAEGSGSGGAAAHVFGPDHERKLDELRAAQIALAQAWARSEADEAIETTAAAGAGGVGGAGAGSGGVERAGEGGGVAGLSEGRKSVGTDGVGGGGGVGRSTAGTGSARPASSGIGIGGGSTQDRGKMEEETEVDILLARKRREANDRYFQRVNQGVLDVVAKLEDVAIAMRAVERESKELWGDDNESVAGSAKA